MLTFIHKAFSAHLHLVYLTGGAYIATRQLQYTAIVTTRQLHDTETVLRILPSLSSQVPNHAFANVYIFHPPLCVPSHKAKVEKYI